MRDSIGKLGEGTGEEYGLSRLKPLKNVESGGIEENVNDANETVRVDEGNEANNEPAQDQVVEKLVLTEGRNGNESAAEGSSVKGSSKVADVVKGKKVAEKLESRQDDAEGSMKKTEPVVDMDMEDEDAIDASQGCDIKSPQENIKYQVDDCTPHGPLKDVRHFVTDIQTEEVNHLSKSKWSNDLEERILLKQKVKRKKSVHFQVSYSKEGFIRSTCKEHMRESHKFENCECTSKAWKEVENPTWSVRSLLISLLGENKKTSTSLDAYNIYDRKSDFKTDYGFSLEVNRDNYEPLRLSDFGAYLVNLTAFLAGKDSLLQTMLGPDFAVAFGMPEDRMKDILNVQTETTILPSAAVSPGSGDEKSPKQTRWSDDPQEYKEENEATAGIY
ncbi:hypothetical protein Tco_0276045 [Tanacetum coccineum]